MTTNTDIGRNDPCHCGSGKKYKKCHLEKDEQADRKVREKAALNAAKVAAEEAKKEGNAPHTPTAPNKQGGVPEKKGWIGKLTGNFFRSSTQRRTPSANKGG